MLNISLSENCSNLPGSPKPTEKLQPFLKWAGGKRQLLPSIRSYVPQSGFARYFEPFIGAGAVLFDLLPSIAILNDANAELTNCYEVIRDHPESLVKKALSFPIGKEHFYEIREMDRKPDYQYWSAIDRAARIIYLNKTCFNGLFRVNSRGYFNVPFGDYKNPKIVDMESICSLSKYLNSGEIQIRCGDFSDAVRDAARGDFIYLDPPYDPLSETSSFTSYSLNSFGKNEQQRLRALCDDLDQRGCKVLLSNSATEFIRNLYTDDRYEIIEVEANRNINSVGSGRQKIAELLIFNKYPAA